MHDAPAFSPLAGAAPVQLTASVTLFSTAARLFALQGLDVTTLAALLAGAGTFLMGVVNLSRELRCWLDRKAARPPAPGPQP